MPVGARCAAMERVGMAFAKTRAYKPAFSLSDTNKYPKQVKQAAETKVPLTPHYFFLLAEINLVDALSTHIS